MKIKLLILSALITTIFTGCISSITGPTIDYKPTENKKLKLTHDIFKEMSDKEISETFKLYSKLTFGDKTNLGKDFQEAEHCIVTPDGLGMENMYINCYYLGKDRFLKVQDHSQMKMEIQNSFIEQTHKKKADLKNIYYNFITFLSDYNKFNNIANKKNRQLPEKLNFVFEYKTLIPYSVEQEISNYLDRIFKEHVKRQSTFTEYYLLKNKPTVENYLDHEAKMVNIPPHLLNNKYFNINDKISGIMKVNKNFYPGRDNVTFAFTLNELRNPIEIKITNLKLDLDPKIVIAKDKNIEITYKDNYYSIKNKSNSFLEIRQISFYLNTEINNRNYQYDLPPGGTKFIRAHINFQRKDLLKIKEDIKIGLAIKYREEEGKYKTAKNIREVSLKKLLREK